MPLMAPAPMRFLLSRLPLIHAAKFDGPIPWRFPTPTSTIWPLMMVCHLLTLCHRQSVINRKPRRRAVLGPTFLGPDVLAPQPWSPSPTTSFSPKNNCNRCRSPRTRQSPALPPACPCPLPLLLDSQRKVPFPQTVEARAA